MEWEYALVAAANVSSLLILLHLWWDSWSLGCSQFTLPRVMVYHIMCEHLEMKGRVANMVICFHEMMNDLGESGMNQWAHGEFTFYLYLLYIQHFLEFRQ